MSLQGQPAPIKGKHPQKISMPSEDDRVERCPSRPPASAPCQTMRQQDPPMYVVDYSLASKSRLRGSCKACSLCCAALSKHGWEQTVNAERGRYRSSSRLRTPHPSHLKVTVHSAFMAFSPSVATWPASATLAHCSRAAPRAGPSAAASRRGAPPARDGAADRPECRSLSTSAPAPRG
jgi:hypothetical protein